MQTPMMDQKRRRFQSAHNQQHSWLVGLDSFFLQTKILSLLGPRDRYNVMLTCKILSATSPKLNIGEFLKTPNAMNFDRETVTVLSAEYATLEVCALCHKPYARGRFDKTYGLYAHSHCIANAIHVWRKERGIMVDKGIATTKLKKHCMQKGGGLLLIGFATSGGLLAPHFQTDCTLAGVSNDTHAERDSLSAHDTYFRSQYNLAMVPSSTKNACVRFVAGQKPMRVLDLVDSELISSLLKQCGSDVSTRVASLITDTKANIERLVARISVAFDKEVRPYLIHDINRTTPVTWTEFWVRHFTEDDAFVWRSFVLRWGDMKIIRDNFPMDAFVGVMRSRVSKYNMLLFVNHSASRSKLRQRLLWPGKFDSHVLVSEWLLRDIVFSNDRMNELLSDPHRDTYATELASFNKDLDHLHDCLVQHFGSPNEAIVALYLFAESTTPQLRLSLYTIVDTYLIPESYPFNLAAVKYRCKTALDAIAQSSIHDVGVALSKHNSQQDIRNLTRDALAIAQRRTQCVCLRPIAIGCTRFLCDACCDRPNCGHEQE